MHEKSTSLLAKISPMFRGKIENVAVEALGHILTDSKSARDALSAVLQSGGAKIGKIVEVRTQVTLEDSARPDLVAFNDDGSMRVFIEAKFWAGLTKNQPVNYLRHLFPKPNPSALLFVAPHARRESLWAELRRRIKEKESDLGISFEIEKTTRHFSGILRGEKAG